MVVHFCFKGERQTSSCQYTDETGCHVCTVKFLFLVFVKTVARSVFKTRCLCQGNKLTRKCLDDIVTTKCEFSSSERSVHFHCYNKYFCVPVFNTIKFIVNYRMLLITSEDFDMYNNNNNSYDIIIFIVILLIFIVVSIIQDISIYIF